LVARRFGALFVVELWGEFESGPLSLGIVPDTVDSLLGFEARGERLVVFFEGNVSVSRGAGSKFVSNISWEAFCVRFRAGFFSGTAGDDVPIAEFSAAGSVIGK